MAQRPVQSLVMELADTLFGKQISTAAVRKALKLIRDEFCFDNAYIYEIDQHNCLHLKEHITYQDSMYRIYFMVDELEAECRKDIAESNIFYASKSKSTTQHNNTLLNFFFSTSLALLSVVDEKMRVSGFILFSNANNKEELSDEDLKSLSIMLSMLGRYIGIRIYQNKISFAQASLETILDNTGIDIYVNDFYTHDILYVNKGMAAPYGGAASFMGRKCWEVLFPGQNGPCEFCPQEKLIDDHGNPTRVHSWDYQRPLDGAWFRVFSAAFRWVDGRLAHVVSSADITENKRNEALIQYMASYDVLTGLPNRRMMIDSCERRFGSSRRGEKVYVLFFDIDGFKAVNDTYGHSAGDELLISMTRFFSDIPLLSKATYRNGGDEFVAIIGNSVPRSEIEDAVARIHARFEEPWSLTTGSAWCNVSIGAACYPDDGETSDILLAKADQAMYQAKKSGGGNIVFVTDMPPYLTECPDQAPV